MIYPPLFFLSFTWIQLKITNKQNQLVTSNIFSFKSKTPFIITLPNLKETKARISQKKKEVKHLSFILPLSLLGAATSWTQSEGNQPVRPFTVPSQYPPSPTLMTDRHILKYKYYHIIDFGGKAFFFNMLHHKKCFFCLAVHWPSVLTFDFVPFAYGELSVSTGRVGARGHIHSPRHGAVHPLHWSGTAARWGGTTQKQHLQKHDIIYKPTTMCSHIAVILWLSHAYQSWMLQYGSVKHGILCFWFKGFLWHLCTFFRIYFWVLVFALLCSHA